MPRGFQAQTSEHPDGDFLLQVRCASAGSSKSSQHPSRACTLNTQHLAICLFTVQTLIHTTTTFNTFSRTATRQATVFMLTCKEAPPRYTFHNAAIQNHPDWRG